MTLSSDEFIRRFLLHVLPSGFHRIRHVGLLANGGRRGHLAQIRELLKVPPVHVASKEAMAEPSENATTQTFVCPDCGATMIIVEILVRKPLIRGPPTQVGVP